MFDHMVWDKITISCDGWTNRNGRPQMNMLHISRHGELAHHHVDGNNETKSVVWIAEHIMRDIEERGSHNVLQFVADNASANILVGKLVRERYPHIIFGGCVAHGLDLLMEDIRKLPWVKDVVNDYKSFIKFIKNHHMTNAMFLDFFSNGGTLLKPTTTRFATNVIMLDRAWTLSSSLRRMVISDRWISWANDPQRPPQTRTDAREAKETILDERFWDKVHDIVTMMENIFVLLRQVDSHKDFLGQVFWESHRWNGWTNIIHTTAMLLNPAYLFDEERNEFSYHSFIMRDFQEYVTLFAKGVLKISEEELIQYLHDVDKELDGITCLDGSIWTHIHREKALSERCRTSPMHSWAQAGRGAPKLRVIVMNIIGLTCAASACERAWSSYAYVHSLSRVRLSIPRQHKLVYIYHNARVNNIDQKRERKSAAVLNTFMKSNTQQSILKQRHGTEYGSTSNPRDAWIPDDVLQENGHEIALSNYEKVRVKTWDWTEPVSAEEVLEDTLQARTMRNAPVDDKLTVGSTEPTENIVYYNDLVDHDFPDDSEMSLDDSAVLPGMEVRDEDTLDAYFDVMSEVLPIEAIRNYTIVDDIDKTKARTRLTACLDGELIPSILENPQNDQSTIHLD
ncbi:hypothetical protein R1sor_008955 [Riccia sorocarpa]|uniref:DUF659 domain-containing protein n=1 Tax=Riccia sorocarpa TaxID=122646 RepID=A0ABD3H8E7_9MARC